MHHLQSVVSWNISNINGLTGLKTDDPDFVKIVNNHTIICLQETNNEVSISGYRSFSDLRTNGNNGGVTTLVSNRIARNCSIVNYPAPSNRSMNVTVVKHSNKHTRDLYIINVYIPPSNSKRKNLSTDSQANFDILHDITDKLTNEGDVIVCGDLNARIGSAMDIYPADKSEDFINLPTSHSHTKQLEIPPNTPITYKRNNLDGSTNSHKSHLLDFVRANNLLILNGRTLGDSLGRYTCFKWNGNSLVDYFMCSEGILHYVKSLVVGSHTIFSDHNPVVLSFWTNTNQVHAKHKPQTKYNPAPFRYKITEEALSSLRDGFDEPDTHSKIRNLDHMLLVVHHLKMLKICVINSQTSLISYLLNTLTEPSR